jgi:hypothetical protein
VRGMIIPANLTWLDALVIVGVLGTETLAGSR